jgi:PAS domain S-box-containing protein
LIRLLVDFSVGLIILLLTAQLRAAKQRAEMSMREADINVGLLRAEFEQQERLAQILEESEVRFRMMADTAPLMIWINDENKQSTYVSRGWLDFTGQSHEDAIAQGWMNAIHPDDRDRVTRYMFDCIDRREPFTVECRLRPQREYRWMLDHGVPRFTSEVNTWGTSTVLISAPRRRPSSACGTAESASASHCKQRDDRLHAGRRLRYTRIHNPAGRNRDILGKTDMELHVPGAEI